MSNDYSNPVKLCDVVMKGGITSGVVYPKAISELARAYSFKNIGGASAGAIAAAAAAAAEYARRTGNPDAFEKLAELPDWIGSNGRLLGMFCPDKTTKPVFTIAMAVLGKKGIIPILLSLAHALITQFPFAILIGLTPGILLGYLAVVPWAGWRSVYELICALALGLLFASIVVGLRLSTFFIKKIPANFYGLSKAYDSAEKSVEGPLSNWLTYYLNQLAGKDPSKGPLTFGDLYDAPASPAEAAFAERSEEALNVEMMTTALNLGRPYRLPFRDPNQIFFYNPDEFYKLFPRSVVEHMLQHVPERVGGTPQAEGGKILVAFPQPRDLPLVVATRMSLSFPVLLAAVPLYTVDYTNPANLNKDRQPFAERVWFSDGGETSNLPIQFFDSPIPRWPTFAIDLTDFPAGPEKETDAVFLPPNNNSGWHPQWTRFEQPGEFGSLIGFLSAIVTTMQNWQDHLLAATPGYRDRVVHIRQNSEEGGLNLDMGPEVITRLSNRGARAGALLVEKFNAPVDSRWETHRWIRFRSAMNVMQDWLVNFRRGYAKSGDTPFADLIGNAAGVAAHSYKIDPADRPAVQAAADELMKLANAMQSNLHPMQNHAPRPTPELRIKPKI